MPENISSCTDYNNIGQSLRVEADVLAIQSIFAYVTWLMSDERHTKRMRGIQKNCKATEKPGFFLWFESLSDLCQFVHAEIFKKEYRTLKKIAERLEENRTLA